MISGRGASSALPNDGGPLLAPICEASDSRQARSSGSAISRRPSPNSLGTGRKSSGVLTLLVEGAHAPLMQHLTPLIVERVNRFFGYEAINRIVFRQGRMRQPAPKPVRPALRPVPKELGEGLRQIADPELRACLESLASRLSVSNGPPLVERGDALPIPSTIRSK